MLDTAPKPEAAQRPHPILDKIAAIAGIIALLCLFWFVVSAALLAPVQIIGAGVLAYIFCGPHTLKRKS